ncbi:hypothetical protein HGB13_00935 [bacterium]|nr:hypothetical protein [bacterium]
MNVRNHILRRFFLGCETGTIYKYFTDIDDIADNPCISLSERLAFLENQVAKAQKNLIPGIDLADTEKLNSFVILIETLIFDVKRSDIIFPWNLIDENLSRQGEAIFDLSGCSKIDPRLVGPAYKCLMYADMAADVSEDARNGLINFGTTDPEMWKLEIAYKSIGLIPFLLTALKNLSLLYKLLVLLYLAKTILFKISPIILNPKNIILFIHQPQFNPQEQ